MINSFRRLCLTLQKILETRGANEKIRICSKYLGGLPNDEDLHLAVQFIGEGAFETISGKRVKVGSRTCATAAAAFCEIDYERVFKPCRTATGSSSETIEKLMDNLDTARNKRQPADISLRETEQVFEALYNATGRDEKQKILFDTWQRMTPVEIKYFIRILGQGSLRIGFEVRSVLSAIARAFGRDPEKIRYTHMITGSIGETAVLAKSGRMNEAEFRLFHPLSFMLATPIENRSIHNLGEYIAEEKFDGMRCQVHVHGEGVKLFSRNLNDITRSFPDVVDFFINRELSPAVFDGEICVFQDETILPFQLLQKRIGLKKPGKQILEKFPVLFIAYDLLYTDGKPIFGKTLQKRRTMLENITRSCGIPITRQFEVKYREDVDRLFDRALSHGNEGLMLKKKKSRYEYGQRKKSWLKVKKPGGTLDTVIMYAHAGSGKRGGTYSDFTLGISVKEDERYEEAFIPIGKVYSGYTDEELDKMNRTIKELAVERYGPTLGLIPELMVEIEFDDIQINKRTKAGYTLRLPRFKALRWDLSPTDADTLKDVERLYRQKIEQDRMKQGVNSSFILYSGYE